MADSSSTTILLSLAAETRADVKELIEVVSKLEHRVATLEARGGDAPPSAPRPGVGKVIARDAGLAASAGAIVLAVAQALQAAGVWTPKVEAPKPTPAPTQTSAR